jgi:hypothetical protein
MRVIKLKLYRGKKLLFNEQGEVENINQSIKLTDGSEWLNYLSLIKAQMLCKVTLESVMEVKGTDVKPVDDETYNLIKSQLIDACKPTLPGEKETIRVEIVEKEDVKAEKVEKPQATDDEKARKAEIRAKLKDAGVKFSPASTLEMLEAKAKENNIEI